MILKTALVLQYLEILAPNRTVNPFVWWGSWTIISTTVVFFTTTFLLTIFNCMPRAKIWNPELPGRCIDPKPVIDSTSGFNIASDVAILMLPVKSVWHMRISLRKKISIILLFSTGLMYVTRCLIVGQGRGLMRSSACAAAATRVYFIKLIQQQGGKVDWTYYTGWIIICSGAEITLGIMIASGLTFPKLWKHHRAGISDFLSSISQHWSIDRLFLGSRTPKDSQMEVDDIEEGKVQAGDFKADSGYSFKVEVGTGTKPYE